MHLVGERRVRPLAIHSFVRLTAVWGFLQSKRDHSISPLDHLNAIIHVGYGTYFGTAQLAGLNARAACQDCAIVLNKRFELLPGVVLFMRDRFDLDSSTHEKDFHFMSTDETGVREP